MESRFVMSLRSPRRGAGYHPTECDCIFHSCSFFVELIKSVVSILSCTRATSSERKAHTTSRFQQHTHNKVWRFATESPWTLWHTVGSRQGHPRYTGAQTGKARGWPDYLHEDEQRQTTRHNVLSGNQVQTDTWKFTW